MQILNNNAHLVRKGNMIGSLGLGKLPDHQRAILGPSLGTVDLIV
jgi:hypothetical protein